jgi:trk system potassium uptake protein TrkA
VTWATDQVLRRLLPEEERSDWVDPSGKVSVVNRELPPAWAGKKLSGLNEPGKFWLTAVTRLGAAKIVATDAVGQEGDVLTFMAAAEALDGLRRRLEEGKDH